MATDPRYIPAFSIETVLLDKDTGAPLSGGLVYFEQDNNRGTLKPVFQITGTEPDYSFVQLDNPVVLSSIGTFEDNLGNPQIPYFYPFDTAGNNELYFIRVTNSEGVPQFTRENQPYIPEVLEPGDATINYDNELSNPQFATTNFDVDTGLTVSVSGSLVEIDFAPDWTLVATGTGTVTINQETFAGSLNIPTNPGTGITILASGLTTLLLRQRIYGSPNLFGNEWISATFTAKGSANAALSLYYDQSNGAGFPVLVTTKNISTSFVTYSDPKLIPISHNNEFYPDAYIDFYFNIPIGTTIHLTSVQVVGTDSVPVSQVFYDQQSNARQIDHLFHYYKPQLTYKPIPSWLVGWDFPLNPAQPKGSAVAVSADGASTSRYVWDQTIVFQTVNSSIRISRIGTTGALGINADITGQAAIIQYLPNPTAKKILQAPIAVNIAAAMSSVVDIVCTVSLWYTTGTLPDLNSPTFASLVTGLDANGYPSVAGGWIEVPRLGNLGKAQFTLTNRTTREYPDYHFNGWDLEGVPDTGTATYFAIVIGTSEILAGRFVDVLSVGVCSGDIATRPAPQTPDQVVRECQYYYEKSYEESVLPGAITNLGALSAYMPVSPFSGGASYSVYAAAFGFPFKTEKWSPPEVILYSPLSAVAQNISANLYSAGAFTGQNLVAAPGGTWDVQGVSTKAISYTIKNKGALHTIGAAADIATGFIHFHYTAESRLGII